MKVILSLLLAITIGCLPDLVRADDHAAGGLAVVNRVKFYPAPGHEKDMLGGKFLGSNISKTDGYEELGEIKSIPAAGQWTELNLPNTKVYRWVKYAAPAASHGRVAKLQFYDGDRKLAGEPIGSFPDGWRRVVDGGAPVPNFWFQGIESDGIFIGLDLGDAATNPRPMFNPGPGEYKAPVTVTLTNKVPGAVVRYTTDGTEPTADSGQVYSGPINVAKTTTICAALFQEGKAPTRTSDATFIMGTTIDHPTFHVGNSLTGITGRFPRQEYTAGYKNDRQVYGTGGGLTKTLWNAAMLPIGDPANKQQWIDLYCTRGSQVAGYALAAMQKAKEDWKKLWPAVTKIEDFTLQPRDFDIAEEADYDNRFLKLVDEKVPNAQPWLYVEWTEKERLRPTDLGKEPTSEMKTVWPAVTWEESMAAMTLYGEDLKQKVIETYKGTKPIRIIPAAVGVGWIHHMIENGEFPGVAKDDFYPELFSDGVHLNPEGAYLVDCMWYAAFKGESPEGKFLPILTTLTPKQAEVMQRLAWDVVKNYPDCGYYAEGTTACGNPTISPVTSFTQNTTPVTLSSSTPGAWFRYTMDGTMPTRTRGYVYCGVISARPGMTIKAVAYKSGMADSAVAEATCPAK